MLIVLVFLFSFQRGRGVRHAFVRGEGGVNSIGTDLRSALSKVHIIRSFAGRRVRGRGFRGDGRTFLISGGSGCEYVNRFVDSGLFFRKVVCLIALMCNNCLVTGGRVSTTSLTVCTLCVKVFVDPVRVLMRLVRVVRGKLSNFHHFLSIVRARPRVRSTPSTMRLGSIGNHIYCRSISFRCDSSRAAILSRMSVRVPTKGSITLINPSNNKGAAVYSLLPHFCSMANKHIAMSKRSVQSLALGDLEDRVNIIRRSICLFSNSVHSGVTCNGPSTARRRVVRTTGYTGVRSFVVRLPSRCSAFINRHNTELSNNRGRHVSVTHIFLGGPPVLVLSRTADTLSGRDRQ